MSQFLDDLLIGAVSRRSFLERLSAAGAAASVLAGAFPDEVAECQAPPPRTTIGPPRTRDSKDDDSPRYSPDNIGGGGRLERDFYRDWTKKSRVPMAEGYSIYDARAAEVRPWPEIEGRGLYLNFSGNVHMDGVILEIPEGKALAPRRTAYEQLLYVLKGRGYTQVGESPKQQKVEWAEGSLFTVPLNVAHRHFNAESAQPARLLAVTTFPFMMQVFGSLGMINDLKHDFTERYDGRADYYTGAKQIHKRWWRTNYVRDLRSTDVIPWEERG